MSVRGLRRGRRAAAGVCGVVAVAASVTAAVVGRGTNHRISAPVCRMAEQRLVTCCEWALTQQDQRGLFTRNGANCHVEWYQNAYLGRALLAAGAHLGEPRYQRAAFRLCDRFVAQQQPDGSWFADEGPPQPDSPRADTRNLADVSTMATTVVMASARADPIRRARYLKAVERWVRDFAGPYSLPDGSWGNGIYMGRDWRTPYSCSTATMSALLYALAEVTGEERYRERADAGAYWSAIHIQRDGRLVWLDADAEMDWAREPGLVLMHSYYIVHDGLLWARHHSGDSCLRALVDQRLEWFFSGPEGRICAEPGGPAPNTWAANRSKAGGFLASLLTGCEDAGRERADAAEQMVRSLCAAEAAQRFGLMCDPAHPAGMFAAAATGFCALGLAEACWPGAAFWASSADREARPGSHLALARPPS